MTAAEMLRDWDKGMTPSPWYASDGGDDLLCDLDGIPWPLGFANGNARVSDLRNALPEIIAVVEAAESHVHFDRRYQRRISTEPIRDALAALDAKLKGER